LPCFYGLVSALHTNDVNHQIVNHFQNFDFGSVLAKPVQLIGGFGFFALPQGVQTIKGLSVEVPLKAEGGLEAITTKLLFPDFELPVAVSASAVVENDEISQAQKQTDRERSFMRRTRRLLNQVFPASVLLATAVWSGCGAGRTLVLQLSETKVRVSSVNAVEGASPVSVPADVKATFQQKLEEYLYAEKAFDKGKELTIKYRFIQFDPGNQLTRWFWGGIGNAGEGSLTVEAKFYDAANKELATIQSEGRIGSGFFGGDFSYAVDKAAEKIAEYTKVNFK